MTDHENVCCIFLATWKIEKCRSNLGHLEGSAAAIAMNKCILVVMHAMAVRSSVNRGMETLLWIDAVDFLDCCDFAKLPTQHVKTLNPHLDHAAFDALYTTEHTASTSDSNQYESMEDPQFGVDLYIPRVAKFQQYML